MTELSITVFSGKSFEENTIDDRFQCQVEQELLHQTQHYYFLIYTFANHYNV